MAYEINTFNGTGADCSGASGDSDRVLILPNTATTQQDGFLVYASGLPLGLSTEYTVVHKSTLTEITFLNGLWDDMTVVVNYYEKADEGVSGDFNAGPLGDFGVTATRTPVTMTTNFTGNKVYTDGADEDIEIVLSPYNKKYNLDKSGLNRVYDSIAFLKPDATLNKYDKITYDSNVYRVDSVSVRDFNGTRLFHAAMLFYVKDE